MSQPLVTFVIPCTLSHLSVVQRAIRSVLAQSVPCAYMLVVDEHERGAGAVRNEGLSNVATGAVCFLDADDWVEPTFAEECLNAWDGQHYIYTDWMNVNGTVKAPECAWVNGTWHVITALIPTAWVKEIGGFDESLPAFEDTDFYKRLTLAGHCGRRIPKPLFTYSDEGRRSEAYYMTAKGKELLDTINKRYREVKMVCCGGTDMTTQIVNQEQAGYVLAEVLQRAGGGGQPRRGMATGMVYEYAYVGDQLWVDPRDADHPSGHFKRLGNNIPFPEFDGFQSMLTEIVTPFQSPRKLVPAADGGGVPAVLAKWGAPKREMVLDPNTKPRPGEPKHYYSDGVPQNSYPTIPRPEDSGDAIGVINVIENDDGTITTETTLYEDAPAAEEKVASTQKTANVAKPRTARGSKK